MQRWIASAAIAALVLLWVYAIGAAAKRGENLEPYFMPVFLLGFYAAMWLVIAVINAATKAMEHWLMNSVAGRAIGNAITAAIRPISKGAAFSWRWGAIVLKLTASLVVVAIGLWLLIWIFGHLPSAPWWAIVIIALLLIR